jgi:hypothetical protein
MNEYRMRNLISKGGYYSNKYSNAHRGITGRRKIFLTVPPLPSNRSEMN